jgi:hypothetical protein
MTCGTPSRRGWRTPPSPRGSSTCEWATQAAAATAAQPQGHGDHRKPPAPPPAPLLRPPAAPPDHPLGRAALATRPGGKAQPQRGDGVPVDPAAHPGRGPPRTPDPHQPRPRRGGLPSHPSTPSRSSGTSASAPSLPRSSAASWLPAAPSTATTSSPRSAPGCAAASCSGCATPRLPRAAPHRGDRGPLRGRPLRPRLQGRAQEPGQRPRGAHVRTSPPGHRAPSRGRRRARRTGLPRPGWQQQHPPRARTPLSTHNLRRVYRAAVAAAGEDLAHLDLRGPTTCATRSPPGWRTPASRPGSSMR